MNGQISISLSRIIRNRSKAWEREEMEKKKVEEKTTELQTEEGKKNYQPPKLEEPKEIRSFCASDVPI